MADIFIETSNFSWYSRSKGLKSGKRRQNLIVVFSSQHVYPNGPAVADIFIETSHFSWCSR